MVGIVYGLHRHGAGSMCYINIAIIITVVITVIIIVVVVVVTPCSSFYYFLEWIIIIRVTVGDLICLLGSLNTISRPVQKSAAYYYIIILLLNTDVSIVGILLWNIMEPMKVYCIKKKKRKEKDSDTDVVALAPHSQFMAFKKTKWIVNLFDRTFKSL